MRCRHLTHDRQRPEDTKAVIQRVHGPDNAVDRYMVFAWEPTDTTKQRLMGAKGTLEAANKFVKYDVPPGAHARWRVS